MFPTLSKFLGDPQAKVRQAAGESLIEVAALMKPLDLGHHVLAIIMQLAQDKKVRRILSNFKLLEELFERRRGITLASPSSRG